MSHDLSGNAPGGGEPNPFATPSQTASNAPVGPGGVTGDETGGVIPYKNPQALIAYYLGLFSLFPIFGLFLAVPAFVLGILGLKARNKNPVIKGSVHAWIGIVMGGLCTLLWGGCILLIIIGIAVG